MHEEQRQEHYRRVAGGLWLAPDHLLHLQRHLFFQRRKRFDYRDIQALVLRQTRTYMQILVILLIFAFLCSFLIVAGLNGGAPWLGVVVLSLPTLGLLLAAAIHYALGPTCKCHLRTAVQVEELQSLRRMRPAREALTLLRRHVEQVQGAETAQAEEESGTVSWEAGVAATAPEQPVLERRAPQRRDYSGWAHALLFFAFFLSAVLSAVALIRLDPLVFALGLLNLLMIVGALVGALVMQHTRNVTNELRVMGWVCTVYLVVSNIVSGVAAPQEYWGALLVDGQVDVWQHETFLTLIIVTMAVEFLLSLFGFYFLSQFRRRQHVRTRVTETAPEGPPVSGASANPAEDE
jgi:hypothetical protein